MTAVSWFAYSTLLFHFGVKLPRQPALALSSRHEPEQNLPIVHSLVCDPLPEIR